MNVKEKLQALLTASNNTTGETDTTLTDAVQSLIDGYGSGSVPPVFKKAAFGEIEVVSDVQSIEISHNLGEMPKIVVWFASGTSRIAKTTLGCVATKRTSAGLGGIGFYSGNGGATILDEYIGDNTTYIADVNAASFKTLPAGSTYYNTAGQTIRWIAATLY